MKDHVEAQMFCSHIECGEQLDMVKNYMLLKKTYKIFLQLCRVRFILGIIVIQKILYILSYNMLYRSIKKIFKI